MSEEQIKMSAEEILHTLEQKAQEDLQQYEALLNRNEEITKEQQKIAVTIEQVRGSYTMVMNTIHAIKGLPAASQQAPVEESIEETVNEQPEAIADKVVEVTAEIPVQETTNHLSQEELAKIRETLNQTQDESKVVNIQPNVKAQDMQDIPEYLREEYLQQKNK